MRMRRILANGLVVLASVAVGCAVCEVASRLFLHPVDYLSPTLIRDDVLGIRLPPRSSGHDAWGFRNTRVPPSAEIVALGDSHTYGNTAKMSESWPHVLGTLTGKSVYNLGMGGYGPNQYFRLLETKALDLHPRAVVCGLYLGDDFDNALRITYGLEHWSFLRDPRSPAATGEWDIWEHPSSESWHKRARIWLSSHSVIYKLLVHGLMGRLKGNVQVRNASKLYGPTATLVADEKNILEAFQPQKILQGLDQDDPKVREGMRITFRLLADMRDLCRSRNILFVVAVISTKEQVFADDLERNRSLPGSEVIDRLIRNEREAREKLFAFLRDRDIPCVDTLPRMRAAVGREKLYANSAQDMHPNRNGYRIIAEAVAEFLQKDGPR
jgi:hypothetical protein